MTHALQFDILHRDATSHARVGRVTTPHGSFDTPAFMPVGTRASVKGLTPAQVEATGSQIILNNAYHLMLRPGADLIARRGGCHQFMQWGGPILTDSGGYQAFSMTDINTLNDDGVTFRSIIDGDLVHLSPERSIAVQNDLGADIIMAFDDCPPAVNPSLDRARLLAANERTVRWLERCVRAHRRPGDQALFGIVQGGTDMDLRRQSVAQVCGIDLPGYAIGGVAVGEGPDLIRAIVEQTAPLLPNEKPRYLMGVGYERDLFTAVRAGMDMFDCVLPTRNGRNGNAFTRTGRLHLRNARFAEDDSPIDPVCDCATCAGGFSRAYLRHLFMAGEMLGPILTSVHNISHFQRLMGAIRRAVREQGWTSLEREWPVLRADRTAPESGEPASDNPDERVDDDAGC